MPITRDMIIQDVLDHHPEQNFFIVNTFASVGLRCVGCGSATHETIEQGARVHGFDDAKIDKLVADLNAVAEGRGPSIEGELNISLDSEAAAQMIAAMQNQDRVGGKLRLSIEPTEDGRAAYSMRIVDVPQEGDYELLSEGVGIYICQMSAAILNNTKITYDSGPDGSGFRFEKQPTS